MPGSIRVPDRSAGRTWVGYDPGLPSRQCDCGFEAFLWQKTCPKCMRPLQADPGLRG